MKLTIHEFAQLLCTTHTSAYKYIRRLGIKPVEPVQRGRGNKMIIDLADIAERIGCTEMELLTYFRVHKALMNELEKQRGEKRS